MRKSNHDTAITSISMMLRDTPDATRVSIKTEETPADSQRAPFPRARTFFTYSSVLVDILTATRMYVIIAIMYDQNTSVG